MIDRDDKLAALLPVLCASPWVAVDTEADSLHAYPEKLCLIQVSLPGQDELIDPLAGANLRPLWEVFSDHELIMHGADYDVRLLRKCGDFIPTRIFDTMLASRLLGCRQFGLTDLLARYLGVTLEKGPQKANWARRPLTPRMEAYAQNDTRHLKPLADLLRGELVARGRLAWHQESCARLIVESSNVLAPDPDLVWRVKGSHLLAPPALAVLREIWLWRETEAVAANKPPYFILPPATMVHLAGVALHDHGKLEGLLPRHFSARRRHGVLHAIEQGRTSRHPPQVVRHKNRRHTETEKRRLHDLEQKRDRRALELSLDPTLIASRSTLVLLARDWEAHTQELMRWQRELLQD